MKRLLIVFGIFFLGSSRSYAQTLPSYIDTSQIVAWYPFNGDADDESGNNLDGVNNGASLTTDRDGISNGAYYFDGINDFIRLPSSLDLDNLNGGFTISLWYYLDTTSNYSGGLIELQDGFKSLSNYSLDEISIKANYGQLSSQLNRSYRSGNSSGGSSGGYNQSQTIANQWVNIVSVFNTDNRNVTSYMNGYKLSANSSGSYSFTSLTGGGAGTRRIGSTVENLYSPQYWKGKIDDIIIWNRTLECNEVSNMYAQASIVNTNDICFATIDSSNVSCTDDYQLSINSEFNLANSNSLKILNGYACSFSDYDIWSSSDDYAVSFWFNSLNTDSVNILSNSMGLSMGLSSNIIAFKDNQLRVESGSQQSNWNNLDTSWNHVALHIKKTSSLNRSILYINGVAIDSVNSSNRFEEFSFGDILLEQIQPYEFLVDNVTLLVGDSIRQLIQNINSNCNWNPSSPQVKRFYTFENTSANASSFVDQLSLSYYKRISGNNYSGKSPISLNVPSCSTLYNILWTDGDNGWSRIVSGGASYTAMIFNSLDTNYVSISLPLKSNSNSGYIDLFPDTIISYGNTVDTVIDWINWPPDTSIVYGAGYEYLLPQNSYSFISPTVNQNVTVNNSTVRFETSGIHKFYLSDWGFGNNSCNKEEKVFVQILDSTQILDRRDICDTLAEVYPVKSVNRGMLRLNSQSLKCTDISPFQNLEEFSSSFHLYWKGGANQVLMRAPGLIDIYSISNDSLIVTDLVDTVKFKYPLFKWEFLTVVSNLNELSIWINDSLVQSINRIRGRNLNLRAGFAIGRDVIYHPLANGFGLSGINNSSEFDAGLTELAFWNSSLDSTEISNHVFALNLKSDELISVYDFDPYGVNPEDLSFREIELSIFNYGAGGGYIYDLPQERKILLSGNYYSNNSLLAPSLVLRRGEQFNLDRVIGLDTFETYIDTSDSEILSELARLQDELSGFYCSLDSVNIPLVGSYDSVKVNGTIIQDTIYVVPPSPVNQIFSITAFKDSLSCSYEIRLERYEPPKMTSIWNDTVICGSNNSILKINGYQSHWINGLNTDSAYITSDTTLIIASVDSSSCTRIDTLEIDLDNYDSSILIDSNITCFYDTLNYFVDADTTDLVTWISPKNSQVLGSTQSLSDSGLHQVIINRSNGCTYNDSIFLEFFPLATFNSSITLDSIFCNTETIQFIPLGYDYILLGGSLIDTISVDSILDNSITVVDQNGCSVSDSIKIRLDFYDSTILLPVDSTCLGNSKQFFIDSSYISSISWSLNGSQYAQDVYSINAFDTGVYKAEILSINGCSYQDSIKLAYYPNPSYSDSILPITCSGTNVGAIYLTAINSDSIWWASNLGSNYYIDSLASGSYSFQLSNHYGCLINDSINLSNPPALSYSFNKTDVSCYGNDDGEANINIVSGVSPYYTFWLDNLDSTYNRDSLSPGVYSVKVGDNSTCPADTITFTITEPDSLYITLQSIADVSCFNGQDGKIGFSYSGGDNAAIASLTDSAGNNISKNVARDSIVFFENIPASNYTMTIIDSNGCNDSLVIYITQPTSALSLIQNAGPSLCQGDSSGFINLIISGGTAPYSTLWNTGDTASSLGGLPDGNYSYTITDFNLCSIQGFKTLFTPPLIPLDTSTSICLVSITDSLKSLIAWEKPALMNGIKAFEIMKLGVVNWTSVGVVNSQDSSFFIDNNSTPSSKAQTYGIRIIDSCQQTWGSYASSSHTTSLLQSSIGTNGQVNLTWTPYQGMVTSYYRILRRTLGNTFSAIDSVNTMTLNYVDNFPPTGSTIYAIEGVLSQSCTISAKKSTFSSYRSNYVTEQTIGLEENYNKSITIFPNPTSNILHISHPKELQIGEVSVIDSKGQVVMRPDRSNRDLNVEGLPNGLYVLRLVIDQNVVNIGFGITK